MDLEFIIRIAKNSKVECASCWLLEKCLEERKWCIDGILKEDVVGIILNKGLKK